jgi:hypothetical protein
MPIDYLPDDLPDEEDKYRDSEDDDFNPVDIHADESSSSEDENKDDAPEPLQRKRKRQADEPEGLDSGDEITIEAARKRKAKRQKGGKGKDDDELEEEAGEGGLIKTRAQRRVEQIERRPLARTEGATVDVDALWAQMSAAPVRPLSQTQTGRDEDTGASKDQDTAMEGVTATVDEDLEANLVPIRKIYTFAGQRTTEEKQVPRSLLDQHLADGWATVVEAAGETKDKLVDSEPEAVKSKVRRPLRRPSRFDANPTGYVRALAPEYQLTWPRQTTVPTLADQNNMPAPEIPKARLEKAQKLNVVDKSRLDWTGFVDKEGIAEELDTHGKTKEAYLGRMNFLAGVEARQEEERLRLKTTAT